MLPTLLFSDLSIAESNHWADVQSVDASGNGRHYQFSVTLQSPDTGCEQYANWWEVLNEDGELIYRRILAHSHSNEQPFTRSGGPINVAEHETLYVRAHMNSSGYGGVTFVGNIANGFVEVDSETQQVALAFKTVTPKTSCAF